MGSVRGVDSLVSEVASASSEQSQGINQVNLAIAEMDKVTQRNAANAEESASASQELTGQARSLQELGSSLRDLVSGHAAAADAQSRALETLHDGSISEQENVSSSPRRNGRLSHFKPSATTSPEVKSAAKVTAGKINGTPVLLEENFKDF